MNRYFLLAVVLLAMASAPGCDRPPKTKATAPVEQAAPGGAPPQELTPGETMAQEAIKLLQRATDLLKSVRDEKSATAVAPELKQIGLQLHDLNRHGLPLGSVSPEHAQSLGRFRGQMENVIRRYSKERVRFVERLDLLGPQFQDALLSFPQLEP
jgi:hypothetical protein